MKSIEEFLPELSRSQRPASLDFANRQPETYTQIPEPVRQAANRGWQIFPVSQLAGFYGNDDLLIGDASCDICSLGKVAAEYPGCEWRVAVGPSAICVIEMTGPECKRSLAALSGDQGECFTLRAERRDTLGAFFTWPQGLVLRSSARKLVGERGSWAQATAAWFHLLAVRITSIPGQRLSRYLIGCVNSRSKAPTVRRSNLRLSMCTLHVPFLVDQAVT